MPRSLTQPEASRLVRREDHADLSAVEVLKPLVNFGAAKLSRERESALTGIYGRLASAVQGYLQSKLRTTVDVMVGQSEVVTFAEYQASLDNPCAVWHFDLGTGSTDGIRALVDFGMRIPMLLVEVQFGGKVRGCVAPKRSALTGIEQHAMDGLVGRVLTALQDVWSQRVLFNPSGAVYESSPDAIEILERTEQMLVTYLDVAAKEGLEGVKETISVAIPTRALEFFLSDRGRVANAQIDNGSPYFDVIAQKMYNARLGVRVASSRTRIETRDLRTLLPGSVIHPVGSGAELVLGEHLIATGRLEVLADRYIQFVVEHSLEEPSSRPPAHIPNSKVYLGDTSVNSNQNPTPNSSRLDASLHRFGNISLGLRVEYGRTKMQLSELLSLTPGSLIKLDLRQGDPVALYAEDQVIAEGEIVVPQGSDQMAFQVVRVVAEPTEEGIAPK